MKKAQSLSLNTIIIAVIVLIVLVVLWAIFTGRMGVFSKGVNEQEAISRMKALEIAAESKGGGCVPSKTCLQITGSTRECVTYGCTGGGDATNNKCTGLVPETFCSKISSDKCDSEFVCRWIGPKTT